MGDLELEDIQGNILRGYRACGASYLFFELTDVARGRAFLGELVGGVQDAADWGDAAPTTATNIAVTFEGLRALDVDVALLDELPREFTEPMRERAVRLLDDVGTSDPRHWDESIGTDRSHLLVVISALPGCDAELDIATRAVLDLAASHQAALLLRQDAHELITHEQERAGESSTRREHFGWADGLGQPAIEGAPWTDKAGNGVPKPKRKGEKPGWRPLKTGEFIHGYPDEDGQTVSGPVGELLRNGTYMVYRKLRQDVVAFREQLRRDALRYAETLPDRDQLDDDQLYEIMASRVVGRWRDGRPLLGETGNPDVVPSVRRSEAHSRALGDEAQKDPSNDFRYIDDPNGFGCPKGAHIRRTNPRDALGWHGDGRMSERHRIIRRGMPYGPFLEHVDGQVDDEVDRGLIFVCFNANIERQFEVIQRQWCNDGNAFHLGNEKDYLFPDASRIPGEAPTRSPSDDGRLVADRFTIQGETSPHFVEVNPPVVHTRGSEYLLVPGIAALRALACGRWTAESSPWPTGEKQLRERIVEIARSKLVADYSAGDRPVRPVHRDQHPKAHGCVEATFEVHDDLPPSLRRGLLAEPRAYPAWVRFSSSASGPAFRSDEKRDAHGMAIKVCEVPGEKVLPAERDARTQDFVLANSKVFFCRDASDYVDLASRMSRGKLIGFFFPGPNPLGWRLRELRNLLVATQRKVLNPLAIQYWSQTPSALGGLAVKYSASPRGRRPGAGAASGQDRLEEAMAEHLRSDSSTFDFMVQVRGDPDRMPIDDPTVEWNERASPFVTVATIHIPSQGFTSPEQKAFAENLSFTPWHSLPEHQPLGAINRIRRDVYEAISITRHELNGAPRNEPGDDA